jgi:ElaB/YqjD/DUF883 family membrane-anchored ribosome-binding protein
MKPTVEQLVSDMQKVLEDLEALMRAVQEEKGDGARAADSGVVEPRLGRLQAAVHRVRSRVGQQLERRASAADQYVRDHAWKLMGVAAVFVLGMLMSRRRH